MTDTATKSKVQVTRVTGELAVKAILPMMDEYWTVLGQDESFETRTRLRGCAAVRLVNNQMGHFVAATEEAILGFLTIGFADVIRPDGLTAMLHDFYVRQDAGEDTVRASLMLYTEAQKWAENAHCRYIDATVRNRNPLSDHMARLGFKVTESRYSKDIGDSHGR